MVDMLEKDWLMELCQTGRQTYLSTFVGDGWKVTKEWEYHVDARLNTALRWLE